MSTAVSQSVSRRLIITRSSLLPLLFVAFSIFLTCLVYLNLCMSHFSCCFVLSRCTIQQILTLHI